MPLSVKQVNIQNEFQQRLILTDEDKTTLYIMAGYAAGIFILWNFPYLKYILHPFKLVVTALHEFSHAIVGKCTGAKIMAIEIDNDTGGVTKMRGGNQWLSLPAGYIGSSFWGGVMVFAGFNTLASKIVGSIIGACFLLVLWWSKGIIPKILAFLYIGLIAFLWWLEDGYQSHFHGWFRIPGRHRFLIDIILDYQLQTFI